MMSVRSMSGVLLAVAVAGHTVQISNVKPRLDDQGSIIIAHDGTVTQWEQGGDHYFYGMSYGTDCAPQGCGSGSCGFRNNHNLTLFTSADLASGSWHFEGDMLPVDQRPSGIYYRPKVVYNARTRQYVLWINWLANRRDFGSSKYLVAVSATPNGPFKVHSSDVTTAYTTGGDFDIFIDPKDGEAYLIYTSLATGHGISIERLSQDYLSSTLRSTGPLVGGGCYESPSMFERHGKYYILYGRCCCFCTAGGEVLGRVGSSPMDFAMNTPTFNLGNAPHAQQNLVAQVHTTGGTEYVWIGDRWNSAPDGIKDHDFQFWEPLVFHDSSESDFRFIKSSSREAIYLEDVKGGVKHHVPTCSMCWSPCTNWEYAAEAHIDNLKDGEEFNCGTLPFRFIKGSGDAIYFEDLKSGVKHQVPACEMCGSPCATFITVPNTYVAGLHVGPEFKCGMLPIQQPIQALSWTNSFALDMPNSVVLA